MAGAVVGDKGDVILINVGYNFTGYTNLKVYITKPDLTVLTKTTTDGVTDNGDPTGQKVKYTIEEGVYSTDGRYLFSAEITDANGIYSGPTPAEIVVKRRNQEA